jgi:hypothetical protein
MTAASRDELARQVDRVPWEWLRPHGNRGALLLVDPALSLAEVGERIAEDDTVAVAAWLAAGQLSRPSVDKYEAWDSDPALPFTILIISPYILIQPAT